MLDYTQTSLHFKILKDIGQEGKNSTVHIAHDNQLDTEIVVKKVKKTDFKDDSLFFDEAKMLYSSNHPNIAPIQYSCQDEEFIYITMPLFQKGSLNALIDKRPLTVAEIVKYSIDFLSGLHHIHSKRLLHCDIKPTNILISDSSDAVLTDFGLARYLNEDGLTPIDKFYHIHIAPETIHSGIISHHSDIFQAGLTVYRLCNGNRFFKKQLNKFVNKQGEFDNDKFLKAVFEGKFPDRRAYLEHIPQTLRNYIRVALHPVPDNRYQSVLEFLNDLAKIEITYNWQMIPFENGCNWHCIKDDKEYVVSVIGKNEAEAELKTTKRVLSSEKERQIADYCVKKITFEEAYSLVKKALNNNSL
jgi:eukaryotic-like serine/threonine-protein kinase